ncbi:MAG TPA: hypothetical protein PKY59_22340 [Pyrinomonadaceae bacterium]|nr:hypothetical protein [Pyrinomonadaceae bacterium]
MLQIENYNSKIHKTNDPLLIPFLQSENSETAQAVLLKLFEEHADPICSKIVIFRTRNLYGLSYLERENLREDLKQEVRLKILAHLRFLQQTPSHEPIYDFRNYVARLTHNLLHDYFRNEFRSSETTQSRDIQLPKGEIKNNEWQEFESYDSENAQILPEFAVNIENEEERIIQLRQIWAELCLLPTHQCASWLLKIADQNEDSTLKWLPVFQIATIREIASAVGLKPEKLAEIWAELPLPDQKIGELFGATQRQVINWRKSANECLQRRMQKKRK